MNIKKWGIYRANLDPVVGSEQGKSKPVVVISEDEINDLLNIVNVLPITSRKPARNVYPNEVLLEGKKFGLPNESIVLCHQIRTLDKKRINVEYGKITDSKIQTEILEALCFQLGIR
ncbi:MAG: type II toxin-antitoxin system PemK/MazF family toxin [Chitinophagaceae bacterium]|nr:type II toxin-antitoxin system PemK/MazF family toxin [Chitinophagaceae bacterium]MCW5904105.1 type II toxin-antitoxin system PemK/MazF family toxin [Chitinophagaceae bacterium]